VVAAAAVLMLTIATTMSVAADDEMTFMIFGQSDRATGQRARRSCIVKKCKRVSTQNGERSIPLRIRIVFPLAV